MKLFQCHVWLVLSLVMTAQSKQLQPIVVEHPQWRDWVVDIQETFEDGSQRVVLKNDEAMSNGFVVLRFVSCVRKENVESLSDEKLPRLIYRARTGAEYVCTYEEK